MSLHTRRLRHVFVRASLFVLPALLAGSARGDIFRWYNGQLIAGTQGIVPEAGINLSNWDTATHNLSYAQLSKVALQSSNFSNSWLDSASFSASNLANSNFSFANLSGADFYTFLNYPFQVFVWGQPTGAPANLANVNFGYADLAGAVLQAANLDGANFSGTNISGANFSSATKFTAAQFYSTATYTNGDLTGIRLGGLDLSGWNFAHKDLANADFYFAISAGSSVAGADFSNADLSEATLQNANVTGTVFSGANLHGTNLSAVVGLNASQLYSTASYARRDLIGVNLASINMAGWDFSGQDLTNAVLVAAGLTNTNFQGATIQGSNFGGTPSFTAAQLYSTASYVHQELSGLNLGGNELSGWNFRRQNLSSSSFISADLTGTDFSFANLTNTSFNGANLVNTNFSGTNLTGTSFSLYFYPTPRVPYGSVESCIIVLPTPANLEGADFTNSVIAGASFSSAINFTKTQLYSTKSYQVKNLVDVSFANDDLTGWNFAFQNLAGASFSCSNITDINFTGADIKSANFNSPTFPHLGYYGQPVATIGFTASQLYSTSSYSNHNLGALGLQGADLTGWNFSRQNLADATFWQSNLTSANFSDADLRGASGWAPVASTITTNAIFADGGIHGLNLAAGETLVIRNHPIAITVDTSASMARGSTLEFLLDSGWTSTITFDSALNPKLRGTLDLEIAPEADLASLVGQSFDLFSWNGRLPPGHRFDGISTDPRFTWDLSQLYTTGEVTLLAASQDVARTAAPGVTAEFAPEPTTLTLLLLGAGGLFMRRRR